MKNCPNCGAELKGDNCPYCGHQESTKSKNVKPQSTVITTTKSTTKKVNLNILIYILRIIRKLFIKATIVTMILTVGYNIFFKDNMKEVFNENSPIKEIDVVSVKNSCQNKENTDYLVIKVNSTYVNSNNQNSPVKVSATVESGTLKKDDVIDYLIPSNGKRVLKVKSITVAGKSVEELNENENGQIELIQGNDNLLKTEDIREDSYIVASNKTSLYKSFKAGVYLLPLNETDIEEITNEFNGTFKIRNIEYKGIISIKNKKLKANQESKNIEIQLEKSIPLKAGECFEIILNNQTIGYGIVLKTNY